MSLAVEVSWRLPRSNCKGFETLLWEKPLWVPPSPWKSDISNTEFKLKKIFGLKGEERKSCIIPISSFPKDTMNIINRNQSRRTNILHLLYHSGCWFRKLGITAEADSTDGSLWTCCHFSYVLSWILPQPSGVALLAFVYTGKWEKLSFIIQILYLLSLLLQAMKYALSVSLPLGSVSRKSLWWLCLTRLYIEKLKYALYPTLKENAKYCVSKILSIFSP